MDFQQIIDSRPPSAKNPATWDIEVDCFKKYGMVSTAHARAQLTRPHPIVGIKPQHPIIIIFNLFLA
jgi:hypothetical protein